MAAGLVLAALVPASALALGVGSPLTHSSLGQPLNLLFPLRLTADETLGPDCVRAEVLAGEARVPQGLLQFRLESDSQGRVRGVRLFSTVQIDEPIVTVNLSLGCPPRLTRQYTAFVDPPDARPLMAAPVNVDAVPPAAADTGIVAAAPAAQPRVSAPERVSAWAAAWV
ncbi:FimV family protein, partial [Pelomonas sp. KK5]|uniref:type IV pilus assembly protein FimV n=1 Tax=Pelomonas sp. KK5 TaxID=1855730 RepID=UPI0035141BED